MINNKYLFSALFVISLLSSFAFAAGETCLGDERATAAALDDLTVNRACAISDDATCRSINGVSGTPGALYGGLVGATASATMREGDPDVCPLPRSAGSILSPASELFATLFGPASASARACVQAQEFYNDPRNAQGRLNNEIQQARAETTRQLAELDRQLEAARSGTVSTDETRRIEAEITRQRGILASNARNSGRQLSREAKSAGVQEFLRRYETEVSNFSRNEATLAGDQRAIDIIRSLDDPDEQMRVIRQRFTNVPGEMQRLAQSAVNEGQMSTFSSPAIQQLQSQLDLERTRSQVTSGSPEVVRALEERRTQLQQAQQEIAQFFAAHSHEIATANDAASKLRVIESARRRLDEIRGAVGDAGRIAAARAREQMSAAAQAASRAGSRYVPSGVVAAATRVLGGAGRIMGTAGGRGLAAGAVLAVVGTPVAGLFGGTGVALASVGVDLADLAVGRQGVCQGTEMFRREHLTVDESCRVSFTDAQLSAFLGNVSRDQQLEILRGNQPACNAIKALAELHSTTNWRGSCTDSGYAMTLAPNAALRQGETRVQRQVVSYDSSGQRTGIDFEYVGPDDTRSCARLMYENGSAQTGRLTPVDGSSRETCTSTLDRDRESAMLSLSEEPRTSGRRTGSTATTVAENRRRDLRLLNEMTNVSRQAHTIVAGCCAQQVEDCSSCQRVGVACSQGQGGQNSPRSGDRAE